MSLELLNASLKGDLDTVKKLLEDGAHKDYQMHGWSALMWACRNGHEQVAALLLDYEADFATSPHPISLAILGGHDAIVKLFIQRRLIHASDVINGESLIYLVASHFRPSAQVTPPYFNNPNNNNISLLEFLLKEGADINQGNNQGDTALIRAAFIKKLSVVQHLVKNPKIRFDCVNNYGQTALIEATKRGSLAIVKTITEHDNNIDKNINFVPPHQRFFMSGPAICHAVDSLASEEELSDRWQIIQHLISLKADINLVDSSSRSPLLIAARIGLVTLFKQLLTLGANIEQRNNENQNIVDLALETENNEALAAIAGAALHLFAQIRSGRLTVDSCKLLLKVGADLNQRTAGLNSPLHLACATGQVEALKAIVTAIASLPFDEKIKHLTTRNAAGQTALDILVEKSDTTSLSILQNAIQPCVDLTIFKIKKIPYMAGLSLDNIFDVMEMFLPKFTQNPKGASLITKLLLQSMESLKINILSKKYLDQQTIMAKESGRDIKTQADNKSAIDIKTSPILLTSTQHLIQKPTKQSQNLQTHVNISDDDAVMMDLEVLPDGSTSLAFKENVTFQYKSQHLMHLKQRRMAEIDYAVDRFVKKIDSLPDQGKKASEELMSALKNLKEHAGQYKKHIDGLSILSINALNVAKPYQKYKQSLQTVIDLYEKTLSPPQTFVISFN